MLGFSEKMYKARYEHRLGIDTYALGYPVPAGHGDQCVMFVSKSELSELSHAGYEELSDSNKTFKVDRLGKKKSAVKDKKHLRLFCSAKELHNYNLITLNGGDESKLIIIPAEEWKRALAHVKAIKNQANKGYALEYCLLGEEWNDKKKGKDTDDYEIKYFNGQIEL